MTRIGWLAMFLAAGAARGEGEGIGSGRYESAAAALEAAGGARFGPVYSFERVAERAGDSVVTVSYFGRDGAVAGSGAGFVVSADGLVATCHHVIGEARPLQVGFRNGETRDVTAVEAFDRKADLAVLRIDAAGMALEPLPLAGDDVALRQGTPVAALGSPKGLEFSIASGVVSAIREFGSGPMIQVAMPIETGNSGGPLVDLEGRVAGLISIKSLVTDNLGFAVPASALRPLLEKPNPIPMSRWLTIGALDPNRWTQLMGARWRQRAGRILVDEPGDGFGGRSLCLWRDEAPEGDFEVSVDVRLDDESGAAGLVFGSDGGDRHFGFYPSGGRLRLTRFGGASVWEWDVLAEIDSAAYRSGAWNSLRVAVTDGIARCFVNGELTVEHEIVALPGRRAGLAKFRTTRGEFRKFRLGISIDEAESGRGIGHTERERIERMLDGALAGGAAPTGPAREAALAEQAELSKSIIDERIRDLEAQAAAARALAADLHLAKTKSALAAALDAGDADLARPALVLAMLDNPEVEIEGYLAELDRMAAEVRQRTDASPDTDPIEILNAYLFEENGYHGSRTDYGNRSNSYLNEVIDDREGLPITLSVFYVSVARRAGIDGLVGVGLPGHFMVRTTDRPPRFIDVFDGGAIVSEDFADVLAEGYGSSQPAAAYPAATPREIIARMLRNLKASAIEEQELDAARAYAEILVMLRPEDAHERLGLGILSYQTGRGEQAREHFRWLLAHPVEGIHLERIEAFLKRD